MQTRHVDGLTIRGLRNGDTATVSALFERLGSRSRERRFCGAKPRLSENELALLARVDDMHHVLVGYLDGDPEPAGIARLVRDGRAAEVAFEVADTYQGRGIGTILTRELAADARAAGIRELRATVCGDNPPAVSLLSRVAHSLQVRWRGGERELVARLEAGPARPDRPGRESDVRAAVAVFPSEVSSGPRRRASAPRPGRIDEPLLPRAPTPAVVPARVATWATTTPLAGGSQAVLVLSAPYHRL